MDLIDIVTEIVKHTSKNDNISLILVNKLFNSLIKVEYNQEIVGKSGDLFSLLKIDYCPEVVLELAIRNNHYDMISYIQNKHNINLNSHNRICQAIGYNANKELLAKIGNQAKYIGYCESLRPVEDDFEVNEDLIFWAFKYNSKYIDVLSKEFNRCGEIWQMKRLKGICAGNDLKEIIEIIQKEHNLEKLKAVLVGLVHGNHFELYKQIPKIVKLNHYLTDIIIANNIDFFEYLIKEGSYVYNSELLLMIQYRRIEMIKLIVELNIAISFFNQGQLIARAERLNFLLERDLIKSIKIKSF